MTVTMHVHRDSKIIRRIFSDFEVLEITDYEGGTAKAIGILGQFKDYPVPVEYATGHEPKNPEAANDVG